MVRLHGASLDLAIIHREGFSEDAAGASEEGIELVHEIKGDPSQTDLPVIITSARWDDADFVAHQEGPDGANAYLKWPFTDAQMVQVIEEMFGSPIRFASGSETQPSITTPSASSGTGRTATAGVTAPGTKSARVGATVSAISAAPTAPIPPPSSSRSGTLDPPTVVIDDVDALIAASAAGKSPPPLAPFASPPVRLEPPSGAAPPFPVKEDSTQLSRSLAPPPPPMAENASRRIEGASELLGQFGTSLLDDGQVRSPSEPPPDPIELEPPELDHSEMGGVVPRPPVATGPEVLDLSNMDQLEPHERLILDNAVMPRPASEPTSESAPGTEADSPSNSFSNAFSDAASGVPSELSSGTGTIDLGSAVLSENGAVGEGIEISSSSPPADSPIELTGEPAAPELSSGEGVKFLSVDPASSGAELDAQGADLDSQGVELAPPPEPDGLEESPSLSLSGPSLDASAFLIEGGDSEETGAGPEMGSIEPQLADPRSPGEGEAGGGAPEDVDTDREDPPGPTDDGDLPYEMPYLFGAPGRQAHVSDPNLFFSEPVGDAVVPGGAANSPDLDTLKKYLLLREQDVAVLSNQLRAARDQAGTLEKLLKEERARNLEASHALDERQRRLDDANKEKGLALSAVQAELDELRFQSKVKTDRARLLETRVREATEEIERLKERVRSDIRKIRVRERELENRLEIMKKDSEALLSAREQKIIELKRKVDLLEFNMDLLQDQYTREKESSALLRERLAKAAQVVRVAEGLLDSQGRAREDGEARPDEGGAGRETDGSGRQEAS